MVVHNEQRRLGGLTPCFGRIGHADTFPGRKLSASPALTEPGAAARPQGAEAQTDLATFGGEWGAEKGRKEAPATEKPEVKPVS